MRWKRYIPIILLLYLSLIGVARADWTISNSWTVSSQWTIEGVHAASLTTEVVFETSSNFAEFGFSTPVYIGSGTDFYLYQAEVNSTHLWLDKTYTTKRYTRYCISVTSPDDVRVIVNTWFPTANSSARLQLVNPSATPIYFQLYSPNLQSAYATGVASYTWYSGNNTLCFVGNSNVNSYITIFATVGETTVNTTPENYAFEITDIDCCDNWVFSGTGYYTFQAQFWDGDGYSDIDTGMIRFSDGVTTVTAVYDNVDDEWTLQSGSNIVHLQEGTVTIADPNLLQVTFEIYFQSTVVDALNVDVYMWCNDTDGESDDWEIMESDYFNIYNLGGQSDLEYSGDAGRLDGGDVFDLYANNGTWTQANVTFHNLQHVKMLPEATFCIDSGNFTIYYYLDYCIDEVWLEGWEIELHAISIAALNGSRWIVWNTTWYNRGVMQKNDAVYMYHTGDTAAENTTVRFWIDLWFNRINASTTIGGRVNAYYYPMTDSSNQWLRWLTGSNWGIDDKLRKQSMLFADVLDANGNVVSCSQIDLMRLGCRIEVPATYEQLLIVSDYDVFDLQFAIGAMDGVQTPVFDDCKVPIMPQGGFLGAVVSALQGLGHQIAMAAGPYLLEFWVQFVGFMDSIFAYFGFPDAFSNFVTWVTSLWSFLGDSFTWLVSALTSLFTFLTAFLGKFLNTTSTVVNIWASVFQTFFAVLDGTYTAGINIWNDFGLGTWVIILAILYPIYLIAIWDEKGIDALLGHIKMMMDIAAFIITMMIKVIQITLSVLARIIESIPVIE